MEDWEAMAYRFLEIEVQVAEEVGIDDYTEPAAEVWSRWDANKRHAVGEIVRRFVEELMHS